MTPYIPKRGDVVQINFEPQKGFEIMKHRPALVLSPQVFNRSQEFAVVCPITRTERQSAFQVEVPSGLAVSGFIRADQFTTLNWPIKDTRYLCYLPDDTVDRVYEIVETIIWGDDEHDPDYIPVRGDVVEIEGEFGNCYPVLVLSASRFNYYQRVFTICPVTDPNGEDADSNFAVKIPKGSGAGRVILANRVKSWDWWAREAKRLYDLDNIVDDVSEIVEAIVRGD